MEKIKKEINFKIPVLITVFLLSLYNIAYSIEIGNIRVPLMAGTKKGAEKTDDFESDQKKIISKNSTQHFLKSLPTDLRLAKKGIKQFAKLLQRMQEDGVIEKVNNFSEIMFLYTGVFPTKSLIPEPDIRSLRVDLGYPNFQIVRNELVNMEASARVIMMNKDVFPDEAVKDPNKWIQSGVWCEHLYWYGLLSGFPYSAVKGYELYMGAIGKRHSPHLLTEDETRAYKTKHGVHYTSGFFGFSDQDDIWDRTLLDIQMKAIQFALKKGLFSFDKRWETLLGIEFSILAERMEAPANTHISPPRSLTYRYVKIIQEIRESNIRDSI